MTQLRPIEVFRKILSKNRFKFKELGQLGQGGKTPARGPMSTGSPGSRLPCRQGVARHISLAHLFGLGLVWAWLCGLVLESS